MIRSNLIQHVLRMCHVIENHLQVELLRDAHRNFHLVALIRSQHDRLLSMQIRQQRLQFQIALRR